jgi:hypothetical protein
MKPHDMAKIHFDNLGSSAEGQAELSKYDEIIQFDLKDDKPFYIKIKNGKVSVTEGTAPLEPRNVITLTTDSATVRDIFNKGQLYPGLADFMFEGKLWLKDSKKDENPTTSWAAKLLRMHV